MRLSVTARGRRCNVLAMDTDKLAALALAFPILAATAAPGVAQACPGYYLSLIHISEPTRPY